MTELQAYRQFKEQNELPVYLEEWFLNIACSDGQWKIAHYEEDGIVLGIDIYFVKRKYGFKYVTMPTMVKYMGPIFAGHVKDFEKAEILRKLQANIEVSASFVQQWSPFTFKHLLNEEFEADYTSRDTFYWEFQDEACMLQEMDGNYRRAINKFSEGIRGFRPKDKQVTSHNEIMLFINLLESGMGKLSTHGIEESQLVKLIERLEKEDRGKLISLYKDEDLLGASLVCWDNNSAYYLFAANNKAFNKLYPGVQTAWKTMQYLQGHTQVKRLDFLGSSIPSIAKVWSKLGAEKKHYPLITKKSNPVFSLLNKLKHFLKKN